MELSDHSRMISYLHENKDRLHKLEYADSYLYSIVKSVEDIKSLLNDQHTNDSSKLIDQIE